MKKYLWTFLTLALAAAVPASALDWTKDRDAVYRLLTQGKYTEAAAAADELLALPEAREKNEIYNRASLTAAKGVAQLLNGKTDEAEKTLAASRAIQQTHGAVISDQFTLEGRIRTARKDYAGAEKAFRRIFEDKALHDYFRSRSRFYYAEMLAAQNKKAEAKAEFEAVASYRSIHPEAARAGDRAGEMGK